MIPRSNISNSPLVTILGQKKPVQLFKTQFPSSSSSNGSIHSMTTSSTSFQNNTADDNDRELEEEFQKLASLVPTIPKNESLTELEFLEFVIAYIQQLQELLSHDQWNECLHHLTTTMKNSFVSSSSNRDLLLRHDKKYLSRSPLSTIHLDTNLPHPS